MAAPVTPSAIASMVTVPGDIPVTSPVSKTAVTLSAALVQLTVPDQLRGRVMSIYLMAFRGGMPLGSLLSGSLTILASTQTVVAVNGGLLALVGIYFLIRSHGVREL